jgi:hypothetical protein
LNKIERAQKAERILTDPLFAEAFENTRQAIFHKIEQTPIRDAEGLANLRLSLKLLQDVRANLTQMLNDGKIEQYRLEEKKRLFSFRR